MASFVYHKALTKVLNGGIDFDTDDLRVLLVKALATTTADTETDAEFLSSFSSLSELTDASYTGQKTSGRHTFTSEAVNEDLTNDRAEFDAEDITWTALDNETIGGAVIYEHIGADTANVPIAFIDLGDVVPAGADLTLQWDAEGIIQLANA